MIGIGRVSQTIAATIGALLLPQVVCAQDVNEGVRGKVEEASYAYVAQLSEMDRYLVVVSIESEDHGKMGALGSAVYRFALHRGKLSDEDKLRVEHGEFLEFSDGQTHRRSMERRLTIKGHDWFSSGGRASDYFGRLEEGPTPPVDWDPMTMPIAYSAAPRLRRDEGESLRSVINHIMPAGQLFKTEIDGLDRRVGYWRHDVKQDIGYNLIVFDPKFGNMPTELSMRVFKPGEIEVDVFDPRVNTVFKQKNETKWIKHPGGKYLPREVRCLSTFGANTDRMVGWHMTFEWWIDDECPDAVFTLDDFLATNARESVIDKLIEERRVANEKRAKAAKNNVTGKP